MQSHLVTEERRMRLSACPRIRTRFIAVERVDARAARGVRVRVLPHLKVETDILALLPNAQQDAAMDEALNAFSAKLARRQIFLIGATDLADAKLAATSFARTCAESDAFANVMLELDANARERFDVYLAHRAYLLAEPDERALREGRGEQLVQQAVRSAFTPAGLMQPLSLAQDPLGTAEQLSARAGACVRQRAARRSDARRRGEAASYVLVLAESAAVRSHRRCRNA